MTRPISKLTKFILSQPTSMPPKEVIARAKARGMSASKSNISRVRGMKKDGAVKAVAAAKPAAATSPVAKPAVQSKSEFIRSLPTTMPAGEVVAKAKAAGIFIGEPYVYNVRGRAAGRGKKGKTAPKPAATKPAVTPTSAAPRAAAPLNKADFVRLHPLLTPRDIVAKARAAGISIGVHYVYNVRAQGKGPAAKAPVPTKPAAPRPVAAVHAAVHSSTDARLESLLKDVAAEMGLKRALEVLEAERARVRALLSSASF
jgi:hypothetical protein